MQEWGRQAGWGEREGQVSPHAAGGCRRGAAAVRRTSTQQAGGAMTLDRSTVLSQPNKPNCRASSASSAPAAAQQQPATTANATHRWLRVLKQLGVLVAERRRSLVRQPYEALAAAVRKHAAMVRVVVCARDDLQVGGGRWATGRGWVHGGGPAVRHPCCRQGSSPPRSQPAWPPAHMQRGVPLSGPPCSAA